MKSHTDAIINTISAIPRRRHRRGSSKPCDHLLRGSQAQHPYLH